MKWKIEGNWLANAIGKTNKNEYFWQDLQKCNHTRKILTNTHELMTRQQSLSIYSGFLIQLLNIF